jgi:pimeloyl-ACP methyl ester carboxylesterase
VTGAPQPPRGGSSASRPAEPPCVSWLEAGGHRLEYYWLGPPPEAAPTLVFLHEGLGCAAMWRDFPERLAAASGCGALVYSRAGYGTSEPVSLPRPVGFMHDEAAVLTEVLDAAGVRDAILFGHSDGASIALIHAGSTAARRVRGLILEAPHVFTEESGLASIARLAETYRTTDLRDRLARRHGDNVEIAFWGWNQVWLDPEFRAWNIEEYLPHVRVPVLLIQGEDDEYGTPRQLEAIHAQVSASVEVLLLPECGHSPHRDQPDAVLAAAGEFMRRLAPSG